MKDKREGDKRYLYRAYANENIYVFSHYIHDTTLLHHMYEISDFLEIKPTLRQFTNLLDIKPILMSLFQPITNRVRLHTGYTYCTLEIKNGRLHCENGPAFIESGRLEWWLNGNKYTFDEYWECQKNTIYTPEIMAYILGSKDVNNHL